MKQLGPAVSCFDKGSDPGRSVDRLTINNQEDRGILVFQQPLQELNKPVSGQLSLYRHEAHGAFGTESRHQI